MSTLSFCGRPKQWAAVEGTAGGRVTQYGMAVTPFSAVFSFRGRSASRSVAVRSGRCGRGHPAGELVALETVSL